MIANSDVTLQAEATIPESGTQMAPSLLLCSSFFSAKVSSFYCTTKELKAYVPLGMQKVILDYLGQFKNLFRCLFSNIFCLPEGQEFIFLGGSRR